MKRSTLDQAQTLALQPAPVQIFEQALGIAFHGLWKKLPTTNVIERCFVETCCP